MPQSGLKTVQIDEKTLLAQLKDKSTLSVKQ